MTSTNLIRLRSQTVTKVPHGYTQRIDPQGSFLEGLVIRPSQGMIPLIPASLITVKVEFFHDGVPLAYDTEILQWIFDD